MVVKYVDGKPRQQPRRSATFSYEFDGFRGSDDFMVFELGGSFDCIFGLPWLARHQPHTDWLIKTVRPHDIDVNRVSLSGMPNTHGPDFMTSAVHEECDGPLCAVCEHAVCAGLEKWFQDVSNVVEQWFPRSDEQRLSGENDVVECDLPLAVEHEFPRVVERKLSEEEKEEVVECGLPQAVERVFPRSDRAGATCRSGRTRVMSPPCSHR
ncbi:polyprotein [Phytophthora megakarya]|uniref:Polyprotein n=1 Tax=Phytophthora megakarya TaxID=4795 RepID=A0A225WES9_9STRA|nr:polyprotein [Phytophthora megakarya]